MITEALESSCGPRQVHLAGDGVEALEFLRRLGRHTHAPRPDVILLDLNMPRMDGREFLAEIKADENLRTLPVVVFTTSDAPEDINGSYHRHANAYVTKPVDLDGLTRAVHQIDEFFTRVAKAPSPPEGGTSIAS